MEQALVNRKVKCKSDQIRQLYWLISMISNLFLVPLYVWIRGEYLKTTGIGE